MRSLNRDRREIYYAPITGTQPVMDEYGNDTLEVETVYATPTPLRVSVSANAGQDTVSTFGSQTEYSRVIGLAGPCPLSEGARVWFGVPVTGPHNYVVVKVADSKNSYSVALREVTKRA